VTYEWGYALGYGVRVIPLLLEQAELHPRLSVLHHLDFRDTRRAPWTKLFDEIARGSAGVRADGDSERVGDMTIEQLQDLIGGAVALAAASAKDTEEAPRDVISRAARSVVEAAHHSAQSKISPSDATSRTISWVDDRPDNN
jgi:hypothetical protein